MKKHHSVFAAICFGLILGSCSKADFKKDDKEKYDTYYSEDYKQAEGMILGEDISNIEAVWSHMFYDKSKQLEYKLIVKNSAGEMDYEYGKLDTEDFPAMTFTSQDGSISYTGTFAEDKKSYTVQLPGVEERDLTFIYK